MKIRFAGLLFLGGLFLLSACGQKGPLYLEQEPAPVAAVEKETKVNATEGTDTTTESTDSEVKSEKKD